jgi:DNA-binding transcriptional LysR family regulator
VGVRLFERTAGGIEVTDAGAVFLEEARRALRIAEDAVEKSRRAARGETGHLEIAYYGSVVFDVIPQLIGAFRRSEHGVSLGLSSLSKDKQIRALRDGWLDIGFARFYRSEPDIATELVMRESVVLAVNAAHGFAAKANVPVTALRDEPLIVFPRSPRPSFADEIMRFCDQAGFSPNIVQETEDLVACLALVSAGVGLAPVPASAANVHLPHVRFIQIVEPMPTSSLLCVYRKDDQRAQLAAFLRTVRGLHPGRPSDDAGPGGLATDRSRAKNSS